MRKILVIDDDALFRETITTALRSHSFETIEAENGRAGVRLAQEHSPDLILSDVQMDSFDGYAALAALRYQPITATIPVILMTGAADDAGRRFAMELGADDYLAKPFGMSSLLATVEMQLKKKEAIRQQGLRLKPNDRDEAEVNALAEIEVNRARGPAEGLQNAQPMQPVPQAIFAGPESVPALAPGVAVSPENAELAVEVFLRMLDTYHPNLSNTARRAMAVCQTLGSVLNLPPNELNDLRRAAALCDIALVGVNHFVVRRWLRNPESLPKDELVLIRQHPEESQGLLEAWPIFRGPARIIRSHHESFDGTGFPDGLKEDRIPWLARLLAVVNAYCGRFDPSQSVLAEIQLHSKCLFDPKAIEAVAKAAPVTKLPEGVREIMVTELKGGLVLARDLNNSNGVLLLPKGRMLTDATVARLMTINRVRPMAQTVLVYS